MRRNFIYFLFLLIIFATPFEVFADFEPTAKELALQESYEKLELVVSYRLANEILKESPKSVLGLFYKGLIIRQEEGNSVKSLLYLKRARQEFRKKCARLDQTENCQKWGTPIQIAIIDLLSNTNRNEEAYKEIIQYQKLMDLRPDKIWILIKLRRFDEAYELSQELLLDPNYKTTALNKFCIIASERNRRAEARRACTYAADSSNSQVTHYNSGIALMAAFEPQEAERYLRDGLRESLDFYGLIPIFLVHIYASQGRFAEALSSAKFGAAMLKQANRMILEMQQGAYFLSVAHFLFAAGDIENAYQMAHHVFQEPDRKGNVSSQPGISQLIHYLFYYKIFSAYQNWYKDQIRFFPIDEYFKHRKRKAQIDHELFVLKRKIQSLIAKEGFLKKIIIPHATSLGLTETIPIWTKNLIEFTGPSVFKQAYLEALADETDLLLKARPYYNVLELYLAVHHQNHEQVVKLAKDILNKLSPSEKMLRLMVRTYLMQSLWETDQKNAYLRELYTLFSENAISFWILDLKIPVTSIRYTDESLKEVVNELKSHPRIALRKKYGLGVVLIQKSQNSASFDVCLENNKGSQLRCSQVRFNKDTTEKEKHSAAKMAHLAVDRMLAAQFNLEQMDINSLNSSPIKSDQLPGINRLLEIQKK